MDIPGQISQPLLFPNLFYTTNLRETIGACLAALTYLFQSKKLCKVAVLEGSVKNSLFFQYRQPNAGGRGRRKKAKKICDGMLDSPFAALSSRRTALSYGKSAGW